MALLDLLGVVNTSVVAATTAIGSAPGTTTSGTLRAGAEILILTAVEEDDSTVQDEDAAAAGTTTIAVIGTIGAAASRAGVTLRIIQISTRLLLAMIFPGGTTRAAEVVLAPEEAMVAVEEALVLE